MPRLDQLLASLGYGSRKDVRGLIDDERVKVAGEIADDPSAKVSAGDVQVDEEPLDHPEGILVMFHKPVGLVCSHDQREGPNVYGLLPERWRARNPQVTSIGRLDKNTSGLLLLTDQSELVHQLTSPKHKIPKTYLAEVDRDLSPELVELFAKGTLMLEGETEPCRPANLKLLTPRQAEVTVVEGRYHQVRRMFAAAGGATVITLQRISFGRLGLGDLPVGQFRPVAREAL